MTLPYFLKLLNLMPNNENPIIIFIVFFLYLFAFTFLWCAMSLSSSMMADIVDEYEVKSGKRNEGIFFSTLSFAYKCTVGIGYLGGIGADMSAVIGMSAGYQPKGNLVAEDYEDDVAKDPRIDALREKMIINEDKRYSKEYLEADKRSIANRIQIHFNDGTSTDEVEVEYPIGHKRRREEGIPVLEKKFKDNLAITYDEEVSNKIFNLCMNQKELQETSVIDFQSLFSKIP